MLAARPIGPILGPLPFVLAVVCGLATIVGAVWLVVDSRREEHDAYLDWGPKGRVVAGAAMTFMTLAFVWMSVVNYGVYQEIDRYEAALGRSVALLAHPDVLPEKIVIAASSDEPALQIAAAEHPRAPPEALLGLARDGTPEAKMLVAGRRDAPPEALRLLSEDDVQETSWEALRNPSFPSETVNDYLMSALTIVGS